MNIQARFNTKPPEETTDIERLRITHGAFMIEISAAGDGLYVRLEGCVDGMLVVLPRASNSVILMESNELL